MSLVIDLNGNMNGVFGNVPFNPQQKRIIEEISRFTPISSPANFAQRKS